MSTALILGISGFLLFIVIGVIAYYMMSKKDKTSDEKGQKDKKKTEGNTTNTPSNINTPSNTNTPSTVNTEADAPSGTPASNISSSGTELPLGPIIIQSTKPICAISNDNNLFCMDQDTKNNWIKVNQTNPRHVAIDEDQRIIYLVKSDGSLVSSPIPSDGKYDNLTWKNLPGTFKQVAAHKGLVCGVNNNDSIFCANVDGNGNIGSFTPVPGSLQHISVVEGQGGPGLHGANHLQELFYMIKYPGTFVKNVGSARQIDGATLNKQCAINNANELYCAWNGWNRIEPSKSYRYVTVNSAEEIVALDPLGKPQYASDFKTATPNWTVLPTTSPSVPGKTFTFKQIDF